MARLLLNEAQVHPDIQGAIGGGYPDTVEEVINAVEKHDVVIVGMAQNPFCKKARQLLDNRGLAYTYLEYGSYFKEWKRRGALKMWAGWQTFPMVFVKQQLVGGKEDLERLLNQGGLDL